MKSSWRTPGATTRIRVPAALERQVLDLVRELDQGGPVLYSGDTNDRSVREALTVLQAERDYLRGDRKRKARHTTIRLALGALEHYQSRL